MASPRRHNGRFDRLRRAFQVGQAAAGDPNAAAYTKAEHRAEWHRSRSTAQWSAGGELHG